ncbi:MAG: NAD(P)-dependent oxidoreductase, partial [Candidatus Omnitrophica bacterium]|nr:NAD(P)-dependent oxidoreductase [Candidatus Omnitrophota bacterium]
GFIGSNLCNTLTERGMPVAAAVRQTSINLSNLTPSDSLHRVDFDLTEPDYDDLKKLIEKSKAVYHFGALGNQALTMDLPVETYVSNALTTGILAALCSKSDKRLLFTSTFVTYDFSGLKEGELATEETVLPGDKYPEQAKWLDDAEEAFGRYVESFIAKEGKLDVSAEEFVGEFLLKRPIPPFADERMLGFNYPLSKLLAERLVLRFGRAADGRKTGLILRLSNIYGHGQPHEVLVPFFIRSLFTAPVDSKLTIWPTKRNFMHIDDLVEILGRLESASVTEDERIINVANDWENDLTSVEAADVIKKLLDAKVKVVADRSKKLIPAYHISNARMRKLVGSIDFRSFEEGLKEGTVEYYARQYNAGCTPEHLLEVLKEEFGGRSVTVYQIVARKRYSRPAIIRALEMLKKDGLIHESFDGRIVTYSPYLASSGWSSRNVNMLMPGIVMRDEDQAKFEQFINMNFNKFVKTYKDELADVDKVKLERAFRAIEEEINKYRESGKYRYLDGACKDLSKEISGTLKKEGFRNTFVRAYIGSGREHAYVTVALGGIEFIVDGSIDQFFDKKISPCIIPIEVAKASPRVFWMYNGLVVNSSPSGKSALEQRPPSDSSLPSTELTPVLDNLVSPETLSKNTEEMICNILFSDKKVVVAFSKKLSGFREQHVKLVARLKQWKREMITKNPKMEKRMNNLVIEDFTSSDELKNKLEQKHHIDLSDEQNNVVLTFAPIAEQNDLQAFGKTVRNVYIDEHAHAANAHFSLDNYYPLLEIVVISLAKIHMEYTVDEIYGIFKKLGIDKNALQDNMNIAEIDDNKPGAFLVFTLIPKARRYDEGQMCRDRYNRVLKFLRAA